MKSPVCVRAGLYLKSPRAQSLTLSTLPKPGLLPLPDGQFYFLLHGYPAASNLELIHQRGIAQAPVHLEILCSDSLDPSVQISDLLVTPADSGAEVRIPDVGIFSVTGTSISGEVYVDAPVAPFVQGRLLALALELGDHAVLHGATLAADEHSCFGVLGAVGAGKSTLSAQLLQQGLQLLTDDLIPVHQERPLDVIASSTHQRMWKDTAIALGHNIDQLEQVHPAVKKYWVPAPLAVPAGQSRQLKALFVLDRREDGANIRLSRLSPAQALVEVHSQGYRPEVVDVLGLTGRRMKILSTLVERVPIFVLTFPSGMEHMEAVTGALLDQVS